jgi:beta,beta-carotene 9',10'-dioxygenase
MLWSMTVSTVPQRTDARLGFTSLEEETTVDRLPVSGELPSWLTGALARVTPALLEVGGRRLAHWFDGVAMLNRFGFADGRVSYKNRFLESRAYRDAKEGEWRHGGFATDPCRSIFKRVQSMFSPDFTDNPNVNLTRIGERYIAMTETPMPIEFDPETLDTLGYLEYADSLKAHVTTAHPHHDPVRGELVNYVARFSRVSEYVLYGLPAGGSERRVIAKLPVKRPAYMHAFGMSGRHVILAEYPLRVNPLRLALSGKPFIENYVWAPEEGTKFQVVDRETGALRGTYETDAFFCFHHVNAFERGDSELVVDLIAYDDPAIIDALYLDDDGPRGPIPSSQLRRYVVDLAGGAVHWEKLAEGSVELPRIDYGRRNARDYTYAYFTGSRSDWVDRLVKVDVHDGTRREWTAADCYPGEPIFVRRPGDDAEDGGVVLSVVLDAAAGRSFLLVVDAGSFEELARAEAPHHIPFGFHGQYLR